MRQYLPSVKLLAMLLFVTGALLAQNPVPNPGFETWSNGTDPDNWSTSNAPGFVTNVTQSSNAHSGASAVRGEVVNFSGVPFPPSITAGSSPGVPFPVSQAYERVTGFYQLGLAVPGSGEALSVSASLLDAGFAVVASGQDFYSTETTTYQPFSIDLDYGTGNGNDPAYATIVILIGSSGAINVGTYFLVDDLALEASTGIVATGDPALVGRFHLAQNYPNPFNPSTTFQFTLPKAADVRLTVYNQLGQEVARVVEQYLAAGEYHADWTTENLPSGVYYYRLDAGEYHASKKLILMK